MRTQEHVYEGGQEDPIGTRLNVSMGGVGERQAPAAGKPKGNAAEVHYDTRP